MKTAKTSAIALAVVVVALGALRLFGPGPRDQSPGLWLRGELVREPISDWSFTADHEEIFVQTRTRYLVPHSVTAYCAVHEGELYLFSAYYGGGTFPDGRAWNRNVMRDSRVRLEIGERLFDRTLRHVTDPQVRAAVHDAFVAKYPEWSSPGLENVHIFRVEG